jgi:epoxyqueuosine reductase QueG
VKEELRSEIAGFIARLADHRKTTTRWRSPLVGFASASDPLFVQFRTVVSPSHSLPEELLPGARTVIAFFLPFEPQVANSNVRGRLAAREWAVAYIETNELISAVCAHMKGFLEAKGHSVFTTPATHNFDTNRLVSDWSHRHVAFAAGLGTFGLNNMLITRQGCCGRIGSCITTVALQPDARPTQEGCLARRGHSCARCVQRCVNAALFEDHFDRKTCYSMCLENGAALRELGKADVCGKCVVGLPCSFSVPAPTISRHTSVLSTILPTGR